MSNDDKLARMSGEIAPAEDVLGKLARVSSAEVARRAEEVEFVEAQSKYVLDPALAEKVKYAVQGMKEAGLLAENVTVVNPQAMFKGKRSVFDPDIVWDSGLSREDILKYSEDPEDEVRGDYLTAEQIEELSKGR